MIKPDFSVNEVMMLSCTYWNFAESIPEVYDRLFVSNPHELRILLNSIRRSRLAEFLADSRVQLHR